MIRGVGNDIIEIPRIIRSIERYGERFLNRIFTLSEQQYCQRFREPGRHYAGRFAAKEAVVKALGTGFQGGMGWTDIEIGHDAKGKPLVIFSENFLKTQTYPHILVSISHCHSYATAVAIWVED